MFKVASMKNALWTVLLWGFGVLVALSFSGFLVFLTYIQLLRLDFAPERAASIAVPLWPTLATVIFTAALWLSTQAQAEATQAMRELQ